MNVRLDPFRRREVTEIGQEQRMKHGETNFTRPNVAYPRIRVVDPTPASLAIS